MTIFKTARFLEKRGLEIIGFLAVAVILFSGWVFYQYAWRAADGENSESSGLILKEKALEEVVQDLNKKEEELNDLRSKPVSSRDIFN